MRPVLIAAIAFLLAGAVAYPKDAPAWVHEASASAPVAGFSPKVPSLVLLREEHLTVGQDGKWSATERGALTTQRPDAFATFAAGWFYPPEEMSSTRRTVFWIRRFRSKIRMTKAVLKGWNAILGLLPDQCSPTK